jgi:hypothetical protein
MKSRSGATIAGVIVGFSIAACMQRSAPGPVWQNHQAEKNEITALSTQIRDWRHEAGLDVEPSDRAVIQVKNMTVRHAKAVCPANYQPPAACSDVCGLADAICDNAETICGIAADLEGDAWADQKCDSAKASCREAKQRCCACEAPDDDADADADAEDPA